jgi:hypothetical protein
MISAPSKINSILYGPISKIEQTMNLNPTNKKLGFELMNYYQYPAMVNSKLDHHLPFENQCWPGINSYSAGIIKSLMASAPGIMD